MDNLEAKIIEAFEGKVVRKDLAFEVKGGLPVPTYVLEYLLGQYCASNDEQVIREGVEMVKNIIRNNYINRAEAEEVKGKIRENGKFRIIDKISAVLNEKKDCYEAIFANLGLRGVPLATEFVTKNPKLLSGNGVWSIITIGYIQGDDVPTRWDVQTLKPIQISNIDLQEYIDQRPKFTTDEWIDFMVQTVGLNPERLNRREKMIVLARLLPYVENNYNFMELGPKGTGKSHVYQEFSPYGVLVSGGDVTSARLFVKMSGNKEILGLVGYWDLVAWDEYEQQKGKNVDPVLIDTMQNYLANKSFNRGKGSHEASASMCFVGNTKHTVPYMLKQTHLFESIPTAFIKGAFLDRIHLYNPGWEMKMLKKDSFTKGFGLITDYISAVLHEMRNIDLSAEMNKYVKFNGTLSERDHLAIRKTFSGMLKLLYPDGKYTHEEALEIIDFAAEGRKRVKDQLYIIDETFKSEPAKFEYELLSEGRIVKVKTLEEIENPVKHEEPIAEEDAQPFDSTKPESEGTPKPRVVYLKEDIVDVRMNQKGVTYKSLFGDYMKTAHRIDIVEPFIRQPFQVDNLLELIQTIREVSDNAEELIIHLSTSSDDDKRQEMKEIFEGMQDELQGYGIDFSYDFAADHDRWIVMDNGWKITLSRGLDIFEKSDRFSLGSIRQSERRCRAFSVGYKKVQ